MTLLLLFQNQPFIPTPRSRTATAVVALRASTEKFVKRYTTAIMPKRQSPIQPASTQPLGMLLYRDLGGSSGTSNWTNLPAQLLTEYIRIYLFTAGSIWQSSGDYGKYSVLQSTNYSWFKSKLNAVPQGALVILDLEVHDSESYPNCPSWQKSWMINKLATCMSDAQYDQQKTRLLELLNTGKTYRPDLKWSIYNVAPFNTQCRIINNPGYSQWLSILAYQKDVAQQLDFLCPSFYIESGYGAASNLNFLFESITTIAAQYADVNKPILPFLSSHYAGGGEGGNAWIPTIRLYDHVRCVFKYGADGLVWWNAINGPFDFNGTHTGGLNRDWYDITKAFNDGSEPL